jgi:hypothetical protein
MTFKQLKPPAKSNKQVQEYVQAVEKGLNSYFVIQKGTGWSVRKASTRPSSARLYTSKTEAIRNAEKNAAKRGSKVFIFDGRKHT